MSKRYKYDYYDVSVPTDLGDWRELCEQAIREANERTRLYCLPAAWEIRSHAGTIEDFEVTFRVRRKRLA